MHHLSNGFLRTHVAQIAVLVFVMYLCGYTHTLHTYVYVVRACDVYTIDRSLNPLCERRSEY